LIRRATHNWFDFGLRPNSFGTGEHSRNSGEADIKLFQKHERIDRPLEKEQFIEKIK